MTKIVETSVLVTDENYHLKASQILSTQTNLSQTKIKDAMLKGAVWLSNERSKTRLRRATKSLAPGDTLTLNYNPDVLSQRVPQPELIHDAQHYSVWHKPFNLSCQGSRWGDFSSIHRWVEINLSSLTGTNGRPVFLVHRLDRATSGLMLLAHSKTAARLLSELFQNGLVKKTYQAVVQGDFSSIPNRFELESLIDGKTAKSIATFCQHSDGNSLITVELVTGRKHQIRRHLADLGFPIVGDRLYGSGTKTEKDLQLQSVSLGFVCPFTDDEKAFTVAQRHKLLL